MSAITETWPIISQDPAIQDHYDLCRSHGTSHNLAKMFAERRGPALDTDTTFMAGRETGKGGRWYCSQLARFDNDPEAWIGSKGELKRKIEASGRSCEGPGLKVKGREKPPVDIFDKPYRPAPDLVEREVQRELDGESVPAKERRDLTEKTAKRMAGRDG